MGGYAVAKPAHLAGVGLGGGRGLVYMHEPPHVLPHCISGIGLFLFRPEGPILFLESVLLESVYILG